MKKLNSWKPPISSSLIKAYYFSGLVVIFLIIVLLVDDSKVTAPLFALVSANLLAVRAIPHMGETPKWGTTLDKFILLLSSSLGMLAAWHWLQSVEGISPVWSGLGVLLVLTFTGIIGAIGFVHSKMEAEIKGGVNDG